ncbi:hypothetical protein PoB_003875600 [Plakobranchus ocellatus]|uniref:Schlafen AlbA-2 domain-containing protein n=1 Tax=Plakobranchus ocellatus TaxID=259542 RepID=A0AAV4AM66_9GAST|nr:hypothetical protein PoB_003875600 [Plakobranchus ocellatus]
MNRATVSKSSTYPEAEGSGLSSPQSSHSDGSTESLNLSTARTCLSNRRNAALVESCIACLANCMFMSPKGKAVFYQSNGLETVIQAFVIYYNDSSIRKLCLSALANYVYFNKPTNPCIRNYRYQSLRKTSPLSKPGSQESNSGDMKGESNSESDGSESQGEEDFSISGTLTESFSSVESYRSSSFTSDEGQGGENSQKKFYVRGSKALFSQDATHELQASAKPQDFVALICGMLNTGRTGTIYLGLDPKDSSVLGVSMDHDARDEMRMSIDHLMVERLSPSVLHLQFHVEFIPVVEVPMRESEQDVTASVEDNKNNNEGGKNDKASPAVFHLDHDFVVEIKLKPLPSVIYCCNGNECFYRLGPQTVVLDPQLIRQLLVLEEEAEHAERIATLQQELRRLKTQGNCSSSSHLPARARGREGNVRGIVAVVHICLPGQDRGREGNVRGIVAVVHICLPVQDRGREGRGVVALAVVHICLPLVPGQDRGREGNGRGFVAVVHTRLPGQDRGREGNGRGFVAVIHTRLPGQDRVREGNGRGFVAVIHTRLPGQDRGREGNGRGDVAKKLPADCLHLSLEWRGG